MFKIDLTGIHYMGVFVSTQFRCILPILSKLSYQHVYLFGDWKLLNGYDGNSENPVVMPQSGAFHQGRQCLLIQKQSSEKEIQYFVEKL